MKILTHTRDIDGKRTEGKVADQLNYEIVRMNNGPARKRHGN